MSLMQDIGIFLAGSRTGESDIKADIYTRGKGKRSFIFKGILKSKKRSGWAMEGNILNITFYEHETRDAQHVQDAELLFSPFNANLDFTRISLLFKILKTTRDLVPYEEATERLFLLLEGFLKELSIVASRDLPKLEIFTIWRFLKYFGTVDLPLHCSICGTSMKGDLIFMNPEWPSLGCSQCQGKKGEALSLRGIEAKFFMQSLFMKWQELAHIELTPENISHSIQIQELLFYSIQGDHRRFK